MPYKNLVDCHMHSEYSPDSQTKQLDMIKRAKEVGLSVITITDHCECNGYEGEYSYKIHTKKSIDALNELKKEELPIVLCTGIELGQAMQNVSAAEEILKNQLDFVLGSQHNLDGVEDFYFMDYANMSTAEMEKYTEMYFEEVLRLCKWGGFDSLGHMNYVFRYMGDATHIKVDITKFYGIIKEIMRIIINSQKAIEINTSRIFTEQNSPLPTKEYIRMYTEMGGKLITVGSDAHDLTRIGDGITAAYDIMKSCGVSQVTYFKNRQPILLDI